MLDYHNADAPHLQEVVQWYADAKSKSDTCPNTDASVVARGLIRSDNANDLMEAAAEHMVTVKAFADVDCRVICVEDHGTRLWQRNVRWDT